MKILFLTPCDPAVKDGGGHVRSALLLRALQSIGEVDTVVVNPYVKPYRNDKDRVWCSTVKAVFRHNWRFSVFQLLSGFLRRMDWAFLERNDILKHLGCRETDYDCTVIYRITVAWSTAAWKIAPLYLDFDDLPSEAFQTIIRPKMTKIRGVVHLLLERWWERFIARQCAGVWMSNPEKLCALPTSVRKRTLRNIGNMPSVTYRIARYQTKVIAAIGTFGHQPNCEGLEWFLKEVWPRTIRAFPELELRIVGRIPARFEETTRRWSLNSGVRVLGFVDDVEKVYENALCTLAALHSGAGTSVKVIESALFGRTILATPFACRGFTHDELGRLGVVVFNNANDFVEELAKLINESAEDREVRQRAILSYANANYTFENFKSSVVEMLQK